MGYNTVVSFLNSDLPHIEKDPNFGKNVSSLALIGGSVRTWRKMRKDPNPDIYRAASMEDLSNRGITADYDISVATPISSADEVLYFIRDGKLRSAFWPDTNGVQAEEFLMIARKMREFGVETMLKGCFDTRSENAPLTMPDDNAFMDDWIDFDGATTTVLLMNDNIDRLRDPHAGEMFSTHIREVWRRAASGCGKTAIPYRGLPTSGKILSFSPAGRTDLIMAGGNTGFAVRPLPSVFEAHNDPEKNVESAVRKVIRSLREVGFSVSADGARMSPPEKWSKQHWVDPEIFSETGSQPPSPLSFS